LEFSEVLQLSCYNEAISLVESRRICDALESLNHSITDRSQYTAPLNVKGLCHYVLGQFEQAYAAWNLSLKIEASQNPAAGYLEDMHTRQFEDFVAAYNTCIDMISNGKYVRARNILKYLKKQQPGIISLYNLSGLLYFKTGHRKKAVRQWEAALEIDYSNREAVIYLNAARTQYTKKQTENP
jgi:tetratricopeptide (TPR) repeat protein